MKVRTSSREEEQSESDEIGIPECPTYGPCLIGILDTCRLEGVLKAHCVPAVT